MKALQSTALCIGAALCLATATRGQVLQDGGFESFPVITYDSPGTFGAWANQGIVSIDNEVAHGGVQSLSLLPGSFIYQDITTTPGLQYTLTFWNSFYGAPLPFESTLVTLGGVSVTTLFPAGDNAWAMHSYTFTAVDTTTRLGLGSFATMQLDDVQVTAVPEPAMTSLLLLGGGALLLMRRMPGLRRDWGVQHSSRPEWGAHFSGVDTRACPSLISCHAVSVADARSTLLRYTCVRNP